MEIYIVRPGDSLSSIAAAFGVPLGVIVYDNQLVAPHQLVVGQALWISTGKRRDAKRKIVSTGYAYTYIETNTLNNTLPFLSELAVFSYGFTSHGDLIPSQNDDSFMVEAAGDTNTVPLLTLTPFGSDGKFNDQLITDVVNNSQAKDNLITQLLQVLQMKGYQGINIDFEYIAAGDRDAYTLFVREMTERMNAADYQVSVALAPKTSAEQRSVLVSGIDYQGLGEAANFVYLMTYEWGYTYSEAMAVAPFDKVRQVVEYAVKEISPEKIMLGIPNYGYDWPQPFVKGESKAESIGNIEAVRTAARNNAVIQFDPVAVSPHFNYTADGMEREVWFEDVRSLQAKYSLLEEYGLRGCFVWQIMRWYRAAWLLLDDMYWIQKER